MIDDGMVRVQKKSLGNKYIAILSQTNRKLLLLFNPELKTLLLT